MKINIRTSIFFRLAFAGAVLGAVGFFVHRAGHDDTHPPAHPTAAALASTPVAEVNHRLAEPTLPPLDTLRHKLSASPENTWASLVRLAATYPGQAIESAQMLGRTDEEKTAWVEALMKKWAARDPQAAWDWMRQQEARIPKFAGGALPGLVLDAMAARDPRLVVENVRAVIANGENSGPFAVQVIAPLGLQTLTRNGDVEMARHAAEQWSRDPQLSEIGASAYEIVAQAIGEGAPEAAGAWLKSLPSSTERNTAIASFVSDWGDRDPQAALSWAAQLPSKDGSNAAVERAFNDWVERNPAEAADWLGAFLSSSNNTAEGDRLVQNYINLSPALYGHPDLAMQWVTLISNPSSQEAARRRIQSRASFSDAE